MADTFGTTDEFIKQQQAKRQSDLAKEQANAKISAQPVDTLVSQTDTTTSYDTTPVSQIDQKAQYSSVSGYTPNAQTTPVAPVQPVTPTTQPVTTQTAPQTPEVVTAQKETVKIGGETPKKVEPTVDYTKVAGREGEVLTNLEKAYASGMKTPEAIKAFAGYDVASPEKKAFVDQYIASKNVKPDSNVIFGNLIQGAIPTDTNILKSPEYKTAKTRFDKFQRYSAYDVGSITTMLNNGTLLPGTQEYNDLMSNPTTKAKMEQAIKFKKTEAPDILKVGENVTSEVLANNPTTKNALDDGIITEAEYRAMIETPDIKAKRSDVEAKKNAYDKLKAEYDATEDSVREEFKGRGLTENDILALTANRRKGIYKDLQIATDTYNNAIGSLKDMTDSSAKLVEINLSNQKDAQAFERQKQLAQYQSQLALTTDQKKFEQNLAQQAQLAKDPTTATNALLKQYAELGILPQRSSQEIIADIQAQVASGKPLGQALSELNQAFQSKTEYKNAMAKKFAPEDTGWKLSNITTTDADGNQVTRTVEYNDKTGQIREIGATGGGVGTSTTGQGSGVIPSGTFVDFTSSLKRTGNNVGQDTNNPGNIMAESEAGQNYAKSLGAVGFYKSPNGRTYAVFPDMDTGKAAALSDLSTKLSGGSSWASGDTTLGKFASGWTSGPNAAYNKNAAANYARLTGFSENTRIKDIPQETLLNAIIANEGVNPNKSADVGAAYVSTTPAVAQEFLGALQRGEFTTNGKGTTTSPRQYTATEQALLNSYLKNPADKDVKKEMGKQNLTKDDANSYAENKPKTTELSDDQRTIFNSQLSSFRGNQQVKSFEDALQSNRDIVTSITSGSGLGDTAAVFQFMKGLDPQSVVREGEFALAAGSAGLADKATNYFTKLQNGEFLSEESQRKEMARIVSAYLQNRAKTYDRLYDDMARVTKLSGIPEDYLPRRASLDIPQPTATKTITQDGYDMLVSARGKEWADNYLKSKGLTVK